MGKVIRQDIYEDSKLQRRNEDWCGVSRRASGAFSCRLGNSEGPWEGLAAGPLCWKRRWTVSSLLGDPCRRSVARGVLLLWTRDGGSSVGFGAL